MKKTARSFRALVTSCLGSALVCLPALARADEAPTQKATAQALFDQARELVLHKRFAEACPKLARSLELDPGTGTRLWLADCYENNGQTASAWVEFKQAAASAAQSGDPRDKVARRRAASLDAKLTRLVITVPPEASMPGLQLRRDGLLLSASEIGAPIPLDPGIHVLSAAAAGRETWTAQIDVPARPAAVSVTIPVLALASVVSASATTDGPGAARAAADGPAAPAAVEARALAPVAPVAPAASGVSTIRIIGISLVGLGLASVGAGAYLGIRAKSTYDASGDDGHCLPTNECDATGKSRRADAGALASGATVAVGLGAVAVIGGAILWLAAPRAATSGLVIAPILTAREGGLIVQRRF